MGLPSIVVQLNPGKFKAPCVITFSIGLTWTIVWTLTSSTHFQWPALSVGHKRPVPGLVGGNGKQISLETLTEPSSNSRSSDPRVFYVHNFLSEDEADAFVKFSTAEENPYKMAHSTGGTHKAWNQGGAGARLTTRTSMNAVSCVLVILCKPENTSSQITLNSFIP